MSALAVYQAVRDVALTATGVETAYVFAATVPPDGPKLPAAIIEIDPERRGNVAIGEGAERRAYPIRLVVLVAKSDDERRDVEAALPFVEALLAVFRANATLNGNGALWNQLDWQLALYPLYQSVYVAALLYLTVEEEQAVDIDA